MRALGVDALLTRRTIGTLAVVVVALGLVALVLNLALGHLPRTLVGSAVLPDYLAHWTGGRMLLDGRLDQLYDPEVQRSLQTGITGGAPEVAWFVAPPLTAVLYAPLAALPYYLSCAVWTIVSIALLAASLWLLRPLLPRLGGAGYGVVVLAVLATQPVLEVVGIGQDSALCLFLWVCGLRLLAADRDGWAGAVLALGLVKPQLFVLVPVLLVAQRPWRALATWSAGASLLLAASVLVVGPGPLWVWLELLPSDRYAHQVQSTQAWMMQGVPSFLAAITPAGATGAAQAIGVVIALVLLVAFAVAAWRAPREALLPVWALAGLTTVVTSPHLLGYDLVFALPALLSVLDRHDTARVRLSLLLIVALTWTSLVRHRVAGGLAWPWVVIAASWCTVPLLVLWGVLWRDCRSLGAADDDRATLVGQPVG